LTPTSSQADLNPHTFFSFFLFFDGAVLRAPHLPPSFKKNSAPLFSFSFVGELLRAPQLGEGGRRGAGVGGEPGTAGRGVEGAHGGETSAVV